MVVDCVVSSLDILLIFEWNSIEIIHICDWDTFSYSAIT